MMIFADDDGVVPMFSTFMSLELEDNNWFRSFKIQAQKELTMFSEVVSTSAAATSTTPTINCNGARERKRRKSESRSDPSCEEDEVDEKTAFESSFTHLDDFRPEDIVDLRPQFVRWFYKQELDKKWTPFLGYDSLRIEYKYRSVCGGDVEACIASLKELDSKEWQFLKENDTIMVRGGLYEVDVITRSCTSIYWACETAAIIRGTWFYDGQFQPLTEAVADKLEVTHLRIFSDDTVSLNSDCVKKGSNVAVHTMLFPEFHVDWYSRADVYLYSEAKSSKIVRSVTQTLGFQKSGYKLQRGFYADSTLDDRQSDITHLVFVVHGVGQKIDFKRIIRNCGALRNCAQWLKENYFSHIKSLGERSEFFPVEWRSALKLDGDTVDSITPHRVRGLREFLNSSAMDIMYYTSPMYRLEIIKGLKDELNRLYLMFCERNPYFESRGGKISIVAHSLGCVITYDILTCWNPSQQFLPLQGLFKANEDGFSTIDETSLVPVPATCELKFTVENLFCLGSPLAVFLALRGVRPHPNGTRDHILPTSLVKRLFNVYHPADPVAYRLEPLVLKHYSNIVPIRIHYYKDRDKVPYSSMKPERLVAEPIDKRPNSPPIEECMLAGATPSPSCRNPKSESRWSFGWPSWVRRKNSTSDAVSSEMKEISRSYLEEDCVDSPKTPRWHSSPALPMSDETDEEETACCDHGLDDGCDEPHFSNLCSSSPPSINSSPKHNAKQSGPNNTITCDEVVVTSPAESPEPFLSSPEPPDLEPRLDYMLPEGNLANYIAALTSHTSYWTSYDTAYFILSYIHPNQPVLTETRTERDSVPSSL